MKNRKKTLFIHIGYPKTGTTTLQTHIFPKLNNIHYFGIKSMNYFGYHPGINSHDNIVSPFFQYILEKNTDNKNIKIFENIKNEILVNNKTKFLISHESIVGNVKKLKVFIDYISKICNVKIIITIREQKSLIKSMYAEGGFKDVDKNLGLKEYAKYIIKIGKIDYYQKINELSKIKGIENIIIWPMEFIFREKKLWLKCISKVFNIKGISKDELIKKLSNNTNKKKLRSNKYKIGNNGIITKIAVYVYHNIFKMKGKIQSPIVTKIQGLIQIIENKIPGLIKKRLLEYSKKDIEYINKEFYSSNKKLDDKFNLNLNKYNYY